MFFSLHFILHYKSKGNIVLCASLSYIEFIKYKVLFFNLQKNVNIVRNP